MNWLLVYFAALASAFVALGLLGPFGVCCALFIGLLVWDYDVSAFERVDEAKKLDRPSLSQVTLRSARTLTEVASESPKTLYQFLSSCKLVRYDHMFDLFWSKDVAKKVEDAEFRQAKALSLLLLSTSCC
jgi:hypothetical protein